ncbi:MAG: hypothetical protein GF381_01725 [Candidatus Pacebacteria bacterium]|nr:hypothetical protein [Candidatus Paceibacterota bacterium]
MRKEVFLAIFIGLVMGLFITFGIYQSQTSEGAATDVQDLEVVVEPSGSPDEIGQLTVYNPENQTVQAEKTTKVTGKTTANAFVVIMVNDEPYITRADETGNFSKDVDLEELSNIIVIHSVDEDGQTLQAERTIIVYDEPLVMERQQDQTATESAQTNQDQAETDESAD